MPFPDPYSRQTSFTLHAAEKPSEPPPGNLLDAEFNAVKASLDQTQARAALIQAADGRLADRIVGRRNLAPDITMGFDAPSLWEPNTDYFAGETVFFTDAFWIATEDHNSGGGFEASNWEKIADLAEAAASGVFHFGTFTGDGSTQQFDLGHEIHNPARVLWFEDGEILIPNADFTVSGTLVTRTVAPANDADIQWRLFGAVQSVFNTVAPNAIGPTELAPGAVQSQHYASNSLPASAVPPGGISSLDKLSSELLADLIELVTPAGMVDDFAGSTAPDGWLFCNGQEVTTAYPTLRNRLLAAGSPYGSTNGDPRVPDIRGRVVVGRDNMGGTAAGRLTSTGTGNPGVNGSVLGAAGGADRHALTTAQLAQHLHGNGTLSAASHPHTYTRYGNQVSFNTNLPGDGPQQSNVWRDTTSQNTGNSGSLNVSGSTGNTGSGQAHPNVQPTIILNKIIKAH